MNFGSDFTWGAATAAYQIEGGWNEDGKGLSVWDAFCHRPGTIFRGNTGDRACDHYHRFEQDVGLMKQVGLRGYRCSLSWPRLIPDGFGKVNPAGLAFYDRLFDSLLEAGITPWVTLFHWDLPLELHYRGGWLNPDSPQWFADYAAVVAQRYSDRVKNWFTLNEPQVVLTHGYLKGTHAPGMRHPLPDILRMSHTMLLAHGRAVQALRAAGSSDTKIGWAPVGVTRIPATESAADIEAARRSSFSIDTSDLQSEDGVFRALWNMTWYADPVMLGSYPAEALEAFGPALPPIGADDMAIISQPIDFFGGNVYVGSVVKAGANDTIEWVPEEVGGPMNTYDWDITPQVLYWTGRFFYERYKKPIVITENGIPVVDLISSDGAIHDPARSQFIEDYLGGVKRALHEGIPFAGYFYWSFLDNFEWNWGFRHRFGLVHVDYTTQKRLLKDSAYRYRAIIAANGEDIVMHAPR